MPILPPPALPLPAPVYRIRTRLEADHEVTGFVPCVVYAPAHIYAPGPERVVLATVLGRQLRALSEEAAADVGERLHHADWVLTTDPEVVARIVLSHDCVRCAVAAVQIRERMIERPDGEILAGLLYWAG